jgi:ubiquinone/menaquinone biosynthesis C-methylase UbiE
VEERYRVAYNLGSGRAHWTGWINVDAGDGADLKSDLRDLSAIPTDSADAVAAIHVLEHFYKWEALPLLTEWRRILKPGGKMILELPCMDKIFVYIALAIQKGEPIMEFMTTHAMWGDPKHGDPLMCHKWGYFTADLVKILTDLGMKDVKACTPRYHYEKRDMRLEATK